MVLVLSRFVSSRFVSFRLGLPRFVSVCLISSRLVSFCLVSSRFVSFLSRFASFRLVSFRLVSSRFVLSRFVSFSLPFQALVRDVSHVFETLPHSPGLGEARSPADLFVASLRLTRQTDPWISARNIVRPLINRGAGSGKRVTSTANRNKQKQIDGPQTIH